MPTLALFSDPALAAPVVAEIERAQQQVRALEQEREGILARRGTWEEAERRLDALEEWRRTVSAEHAAATWDHIAHSPCASTEKARRLLGYAPRYSSLEAAREALVWLIAHGRVSADEVMR